jgi:hypothetical protein
MSFNLSLVRVLVCACALVGGSLISTAAMAAPPEGGKPAQKAHAHRGHHRHLTKRQKARIRHFLHNHPGALKQLRQHASAHRGQGHGQHRGGAHKPSAN